jgi:hypothetical protein
MPSCDVASFICQSLGPRFFDWNDPRKDDDDTFRYANKTPLLRVRRVVIPIVFLGESHPPPSKRSLIILSFTSVITQ